jgi:ABC-2 type transport system permease protein
VGMVIGIVLGAVGGSIVPIPEKGFLHVLSQFTPQAHAIEGYLKLTSQGAGVVEILPQVGLLAGVGVLFFLIAVSRFRLE